MNYLYFNIDLLITINEVSFARCVSIEIEQSINTLTNTAKITLPREYVNSFKKEDKQKNVNLSKENILNHIKIGYPVTIKIGYDGKLKTEFEGYVTNIQQNTPLIIECQDEMYKLKKAPKLTKYNKGGSLNKFLRSIIPTEYDLEINEVYNIGKWGLKDCTPYDALADLQEYGIRAYFKNPKTLCVGLKVDFKPTKSHLFNFNENVRRTTSIQLVTEQKTDLLVTLTSMQPNGEKLSYSIGEKGGNTYDVDFTPNISLDELKYWTNQIYQSKLRGTLNGTLDSWGLPRTKAGDVAIIRRPFYIDKHQDGRYIIESVRIIVDENNGFKRENKLSYKLFNE